MKKNLVTIGIIILIVASSTPAFSAYHHEGEMDAEKFLEAYPDKAGTKLDHCALCHSGGEYEKKPGKWVTLGSCQWCHHSYGYDGAGNITDTMNPYGTDYKANGRNTAAISAIDNFDSDGDGFTNKVEIEADRFPGNADDDPDKVAAPFRIYTRAQLKAMTQHTQFLLMNASRKTDNYVEYTGIPMEILLQDAGMLDSATGVTVYAPDAWANDHPLEEDAGNPEVYHVKGIYPPATYHYHEQADEAINTVDGWCDYSAPSCQGRSHGEAIAVSGGLKMILAYKRDGVYMDPGVLNDENKLDGEGPFRLVPPQKNPGPPDQSSYADNQEVIWPYDEDGADHNAGSSSRSVTIIKVQPLPDGTTDIDVYEDGWQFVDENKIVVYGAIDGTDSNGNGILDSEEGTNPDSDFDGDGTPDFQDADTARVRHAKGSQKMLLHATKGALADVKALSDDDPEIPQQNKPAQTFPYGACKFKITGLTPGAGESVTVSLVFPDNVPVTAKYYKITASGWNEIPFGSNDGDNTITITLTDGDAATDSDGANNGTIVDPGALATGTSAVAGDSGGGCFIATAAFGSYMEPHVKILRKFRDSFLTNNSAGKAFVNLYYTCSPPIADCIARHSVLQIMARLVLLPLVGMSWLALNPGPGAVTMSLILISTTILILFRKRGLQQKYPG